MSSFFSVRSKIYAWISIAALAALAVLPMARPGVAQDSAPVFDARQSDAIEKLVRDYLLEHPEVLIEALRAYEQKQQAAEAERQSAVIRAETAALLTDPDAPVLGNPQGDVTLVEFFDYRCPYCKRASGTLIQLMKEDPQLRVVMKEFPILSQESVRAARAALAATRQDKYQSFHFELMENGGSFTDAEIFAVAASVGLDEARLRADMQDPAIERALRRTNALAERIGVTGTPAFIIGDTLVPGAVGIDQLRALVAEVRAKQS